MNGVLTQFLIDIVRGVRKDEFASDPDAVLSGSVLDNEMQQAIRSRDIATLWLAGAHPMALMYFARSIGWSNERYYACLDEVALKRFARADCPSVDAHALQHRRQ